MSVKRLGVTPEAARVAIAGGVAYCDGLLAQNGKTFAEQLADVLSQANALLADYNFSKNKLLYFSAYLRDISNAPEFEAAFYGWADANALPAGVIVQGIPHAADKAFTCELALSLMFAAEDAEIERIPGDMRSLMVKYNGIAYYSGIRCPEAGDFKSQVEGVLQKYQALFDAHGLRRENMLVSNSYVRHISDFDAVGEFWEPFSGDTPPAGIMVEASPMQNAADGSAVLFEQALYVATEEGIERIDISPAMCRFAVYKDMVYFTGHSPRPELRKSLSEQSRAVLDRYDELFGIFGLKKENIVSMYAYMDNAEDFSDFFGAYRGWPVGGCPAANMPLGAKPGGGADNKLELQFFMEK